TARSSFAAGAAPTRMKARFIRLAAPVFLVFLPLFARSAELMRPEAEIEMQNATIRLGVDLLYKEDFKEIERIGVALIAGKEKQPFSVWKIRHFSDAITRPKNVKDAEDWEFVIGKWEDWQRESGSAFSLAMLGKAYLNYGH